MNTSQRMRETRRAPRGSLILPRGTKQRIEAKATTAGDKVTVGLSDGK